MEMPKVATALLLPFLLLHCATTAAALFTCNSAGAASSCRAVVGFQTINATTYGAIKTLFQVPALSSLLGANNLPLSTPADRPVPASSTVFVPVPCLCSDGIGRSDGTPIYTVKAGDQGLYDIATNRFGGLVAYQDIGTVNNLTNINVIKVDQQLWIPLPCSCDEIDGEAKVHLAHKVASGSSVEAIAAEFGTNETTLLKLNNMTDPKTLQADQILDVPLKACSSYITNSSADYNLRLANNSYSLTANDCVLCSCSANTYQLECYQTKSTNTSRCSVTQCSGGLSIGNSSTSGCVQTTCSYTGYTNTSILVNVLTAATNQSTCSNAGTPQLELRLGHFTALLLFLHTVWSFVV